MVQNGCLFHELLSEDPNQHLKDFLKSVDSLDLDGENKEGMRLRLFQFSLRDQASNWLESLSARSITTWEDLTTHFLAQFFPPRRTAKLHTDILMFQQHQGESLSEAWTRFKDLLQKVPHHGIDIWLQVQIFYDYVNPIKRQTIHQSAGGKLRDRNAKESWALFEDLTLYDNEIWNDPRVSLSRSRQSLCLKMSQICSGPHDTQYCMEDPEQAFVEYASSRTDEAGDARLSKFKANFKQQQSEMTNKIDIVLKAITNRIAGALPSDTVKNPKLNINTTTLVLSARSYPTEDPQCSTHIHGSINTITIHPKQQSNSHDDKPEENGGEEKNRDDGDVMFIEIVKKNDDSRKEEPEAGGLKVIFDEKKLESSSEVSLDDSWRTI
ncbi:zinc finger, CCHC-type containing protein [Tanacetum coccineum]